MKKNIEPINNPKEPKIIKTTMDLKNFNGSFLSSCFKYYYGKLKIINTRLNQKKEVPITDSFLSVKNEGSLFILDYPNIIYTLHEKYKKRNKVIQHFYLFICDQLKKRSKIYIISKNVVIDDNAYDIETVFNTGRKLTGKNIDNEHFTRENICIFNIDYEKKMSSSTDDLLGWFICLNLFTYLLRSNKDPNKSYDNGAKKLNLITNDKQLFDKNLFGLTEDERRNHVVLIRDIMLKKLIINNNNFELVNNPYDCVLVRQFLSDHVVADINDTEDLECNISVVLELLMKPKSAKNKYQVSGYYRQNKWPEYNQNYVKTNFTRKKMPSLSYSNINSMQKKEITRGHIKTCKRLKKIRNNKNNDIIDYYYLYVFIKYVQSYMNTTKYDNLNYGDFFGSLSKDEMREIIG
jgi:hypothetical protein